MKLILLTTLSILISSSIFGQTSKAPNGFYSYTNFKENNPTLTYDFQVYKRTDGDIFMTGGIANYRLKKISPKSETSKVEKEVWGIIINDTVYINSYPYSKIKGYNLILEKGFYTYFIGEPARVEKEQKELGIIKPSEKPIPVCCQVDYVILPNGTIKLLRPELLVELCKDNEEISKEIKSANFKLEDVNQMFAILKKYNSTKR